MRELFLVITAAIGLFKRKKVSCRYGSSLVSSRISYTVCHLAIAILISSLKKNFSAYQNKFFHRIQIAVILYIRPCVMVSDDNSGAGILPIAPIEKKT